MENSYVALGFLSLVAQSWIITSVNGLFNSHLSLNISDSNITITDQMATAYVNTLYATGKTRYSSFLLLLVLILNIQGE